MSTNATIDRVSAQLGADLQQLGLLDRVQLQYMHQKRAVNDDALWRVLIKEGLVGEHEVVQALARILDVPFVEIEQVDPPEPAVLALFNAEMCQSANFLPLKRQNNELLVLLGDALPDDVRQIVFRRTALRCSFVMAPFSRVLKLARYCYYFVRNPPEKLVAAEVARLRADSDLAYTPEQLLTHLLHWAVRERATDVHIAPGASSLHFLFRIDGVLQPILAAPHELVRLLGYIKLISEMDISEQRRPQDGSFRITVFDEPLTIRVSTLIVEFGERMVMRLLPESHDIGGLQSLGYLEDDVRLIARAMERPNGLILITGPTGSGKSSTLHAGLRMQHLIERNVLTVEDPREYRVPAAGQTQVNRKSGYDFEVALRHFLRHDPDVILVGEMRDAETAQAAFDAAATGHLVLSTLHVTSVFGVVPRLRPFGLSPQVIAENLCLIINQRLVRRLCKACAADHVFPEEERVWLGLPEGALGKRAVGCPRCRDTGFYGRLPLYEMLIVDDELANAIADDAGRELIREIGRRKGFKPISEIAKWRVVQGQTTSEEVYRTIGVGPADGI